jgi:membrane-associated protein
MDVLPFMTNFILHVDQTLGPLVQTYGIWVYLIIFVVIFSETGFVLTPFLPGDSLLFVAGWLASIGSMNIWLLFIVFSLAAIIGDTVNYFIGKYVGPKLFKGNRFKRYMDEAREFYEKHGSKSIVLARFVPFIRTFVPFAAGMGMMNYRRFLAYNVLGGLSWVAIFLAGGYFFGNIPVVKDNLSLVIIIIILITMIPAIIKFLSTVKRKQHE